MARIRPRVVGGWLLASGLLATAVVGACGAKKGGLMLAINTDMRAPKDVNAVSVTISTNGAIKHSFIGRVTPQGEVLLPATLAVVEPDDKTATIRIRVMAFQERKPRVLRDVRTTVPTGGRTALLRIPLNFVNDASAVGDALPSGLVPDPIPGTGSASNGSASGGAAGTSGMPPSMGASSGAFTGGAADFDFFGSFQPPCADIQNQTIIDGECKDNFVDSSSLPDFEQSALGDSTDHASCFDLARCFAGATGVGDANTAGDPTQRDGGSTATPDASPPSGDNSCPANLPNLCQGVCVDLQSDANNCRSCHNVCPAGQGCKGGICGPAQFKDFRPGAVTLDRNMCALQLNGADPARLNLALVTSDTGECVRPGECYIPIDRGAAGWHADNGRVQLPSFVCALLNKKNLRLATSTETCAAKEEKNPICTPKVGEKQPDASFDGPSAADTGVPPAAFYVPADFATAAVVVNGTTLRFASASLIAEVDLRNPGAKASPILGAAAPSHLPWRFSSDGMALVNGSSTGFTQSGPVQVAQGAIDVASVAGGHVWAVYDAAQGGVFEDVTPSSQASRLTFTVFNGTDTPIGNVTAVGYSPGSNAVAIGELNGSLRFCSLTNFGCGQHITAEGRIDVGILKPNDPKFGYLLAATGLYGSMSDPATGQLTPAALLVPAQASGVQDGSGYYARGLAANSLCVVFSAADGVHFSQGQGNMPGPSGLVVAPAKGPILGVAIGPEGASDKSALYYAVYAPASQGGGIYRAPLATACGGSGGGGNPGDAGTDSGTCGVIGAACAKPSDCCSFMCKAGGTCGSIGCVANGAACAVGADCCSGLCNPDGLGGGKCG